MATVDQTIDHLPLPRQLGRYRITERMGSGGRSTVYKGWDDELRREVAVKVTNLALLARPGSTDAYLAEARQVAQLDHPGIVPLYDVGRTADGGCFLVTKLVSGPSLAARMRRGGISRSQAASLVARVAEALHAAHKKGLIHGGVKPSNILLDEHDQPLLTDFGLSLTLTPATDAQSSDRDAVYRSPEQNRGAAHRIDARSDLYSLAVVLYELLAGRPPATATSLDDEPAWLSEINPEIPPELARVCHKALSRRVADRYTTALDFATELRECQSLLTPPHQSRSSTSLPAASFTPPPGDSGSSVSHATLSSGAAGVSTHKENAVCVIPKGLRSYDREDADFFLELLPGPRGRDGLPDSLRFWKTRLEETQPDKTFAVGLLYGPSGCGKSSLVKAGLLPRLDDRVVRIYLEATMEGTEHRLLNALRRHCPGLPSDLPLTQALAELRRGQCLPSDRKVVIFIDQFEQWLHANRDNEHPELTRALRQCDGRRVQCVVMVRDDFWMAVTRFMHDLELRLVQHENTAAVDLFGPQHARKVLIAFGRAYGCLPAAESEMSAAEKQFLDQAIAGLSRDGKVVSVQLALFADMIKQKPWTPATLVEVGGTAGIGLAFLEETFSSPHSPPVHRKHQRATRAVLKLLLPEPGADIKGQMRSLEELQAAAGYADQDSEFQELLQILDSELRLLTPADPEGASDETLPLEASAPRRSGKYYQLTHDFLVPSIRRWLVRRQQETRRGRAELLLAGKADVWRAHPSRRYLPSWWQWLRIRTLTSPRDWTASERTMMRSARRYHGIRALLLAVCLVLSGWGTSEGYQYVQARIAHDRLIFSRLSDVPQLIDDLAPRRRFVDPMLRATIDSAAPGSQQVLHARLGLLPMDSGQAEPLLQSSLDADQETWQVIADALVGHRELLIGRLWKLVEDQATLDEHRLRAAMLLARYSPPGDAAGEPRWEAHATPIAERLHRAAVADPTRFNWLIRELTPASAVLLAPLRDRSRDEKLNESERTIAGNILVEYASVRADVLTELLLEGGNPSRQSAVIGKLASLADQATPLLQAELVKEPQRLRASWTEKKSPDGPPPAADAARAVEAAAGMIVERFAFCQTLPFGEFDVLAESLRTAGYRPTRVRPYRTGEHILVSALWTRDGRDFRLQRGQSEDELKKQVSGERMTTDLLVDLAAYDEADGKTAYVALWTPRQPEDPEAIAYIGPSAATWNEFLQTQTGNGFGVVSADFRHTPGRGSPPEPQHAVAAVFWKGVSARSSAIHNSAAYEDVLAGEHAGKLQVAIDLVPTPVGSSAGIRRNNFLTQLAQREKEIAANAENLGAWFEKCRLNFSLGRDEVVIRDATHYVDKGGEPEPNAYRHVRSRELRVLAAARLGRTEEVERYLTQDLAANTRDQFNDKKRRALAAVFTPRAEEELLSFEEFVRQRGPKRNDLAEVLAFAAGYAGKGDSEKTRLLTEKAVATLEESIRNVDRKDRWYRDWPHFAPILDHPRVQRLEVEFELDRITPIRHARAGEIETARRELENYLKTETNAQTKLWVDAAVSAYLGEHEQGLERVEAAIAGKNDGDLLKAHGASPAYALTAFILTDKAPDQAKACSDRAVELLSKRMQRGIGPDWTEAFRRELLTNWWCHPLRDHPGFQKTLRSSDWQIWLAMQSNSEFESSELHGFDPQAHLAACREFAQQGWRPVSLDAGLPAGASVPGTASVWHRPIVSQKQRDQLAQRQSSAAVGLLRLKQPESAFRFLKADPDPRVRTDLIQRLTAAGSELGVLAGQLEREPDPSVRAALILALGQTPLDKLSEGDREAHIQRLQKLFRSDPDPGVHSAAEWSLRKWAQSQKLADAKKELSKAPADSSGRWMVNTQGLTLVVFNGPIEFNMGSPIRESDRESDETLHRRRIPRSFAIATTEVTVRQFQQFLRENPQVRIALDTKHSPDPDCPVGAINWYHMAQFCRWLSEKDGVPEDDMCFPSIPEIKAGMMLKPYWLSRSGYRFPTEAEWEYVCRAGTTASRYYGESLELLPKYAWFKDNAQDRTWPVGSLLPNEWGLFDLYGNVNEHCLQHLVYPATGASDLTDNISISEKLPDQLSLRSGSYLHEARWMRSADRYDYKVSYDAAAPHIGFRVARTLPPPDLLAARSLRRAARDLRQKGQSATAQSTLAQAQLSYEKLLAAAPENDATAWELADFLLDNAADSTNGTPLETLRKKLAESTLGGQARLAIVHAALARRVEALAALKAAGSLPKSENVYDQFLLTQLHLQLDQTDEAREWLDRLLARIDSKPDDASSKALAAEAFSLALSVVPDDDRLFARLIQTARKQGSGEALLSLYDRAVELRPNDAPARIARARLHATAGRHELAEADFAGAAELTAGELHRFIEAGWWVAGPYPFDLAQVCPPEKVTDLSHPVAKADGSGDLKWQDAVVGEHGQVNLAPLLANAQNVSGYAISYVYSPDDRPATLRIGGDNQARVWLNGRLVHELTKPNGWYPDLDRVPVTLQKGRNTLLVKVNRTSGGHYLYCRIADNPLDQGQQALELGLWKESLSWLEQYESRFPKDAPHLARWRLLASLAMGDMEAARQQRSTIADRFGKSDDLAVCYAFGYLADNPADLKRFAELEERGITANSSDTWRLYYRGVSHLRAGEFPKALARLQEHQKRTSDYVVAWPALALTYHRLGKNVEAKRFLEKADQWFDQSAANALAALPFRLPLYYEDLVSFSIFRREAREAIHGKPAPADDSLEKFSERAREWLARLDPATVDFDLALQRQPEEPRLWVARGQRLGELERWRLAQADFDSAPKFPAGEPARWTPEAVDMYLTVLDRTLVDKERLNRRASVLSRAGRRDQAVAGYKQLAEQDPQNGEWSLRLAQLQPDVAAAWNFDAGPEGWEFVDCRLSAVNGALHVENTGNDPHFRAKFAAPSGWKLLTLRTRTAEPVNAQFFWATTRSGESEKASRRFKIPASSDWQEIVLVFETAERMVSLRLDSENSRVGRKLEIDSIVLKSVDEEAAHTQLVQSNDPQDWIGRAQMFVKRGRPAEAAADFSKALDLFSQDQAWYSPRSKALRDLVRDDSVFAKLVELRPKDPSLWIELGRFHAAHSRWPQAAEACAKVIKSRPASEEWCEYAALLLLNGDRSGYREVTGEMIERFDKQSGFLAYVLARTNSLTPEPMAPAEQAVPWAERALSDGNKPWFLHVLGMAHLRAGQLTEAVARFQESRLELGWGERPKALNLLGLSIAYFHAGRDEAARDWLTQAKKLIPPDGATLGPADWLEMQVLLREAVQLAEPKPDTGPTHPK